jgi:hypothetical protein
MDRYWKKVQAMLIDMARSDPNATIRRVYESGMTDDEVREIGYIVDMARRAVGYDESQDVLKEKGIY